MTHRESASEDGAQDGETPQAVAAALAETHLPAMAAAGYIEWDPETKTIQRGPNFEQAVPVLRLLNDPADALSED